LGPGAHSHLDGRRWWNHKQPARWASALSRGESPTAGAEQVGPAEDHEERVLLELRLATGLPMDVLTPTEADRVPSLVADGLATLRNEHIVLTLKGRLLADKVTLDLLD